MRERLESGKQRAKNKNMQKVRQNKVLEEGQDRNRNIKNNKRKRETDS